MKTIVTHIAPDVDAVTSVWLLKRFLPGWEKADVDFVPAGKTLNNEIVDSDPEILHVDTGMGILDHHQTDEDTCAARRCLEYIKSKTQKSKSPGLARRGAGKNQKWENEALERLVEVVNDIDHFREVYYPNPNADFYEMGLIGILDGLKLTMADKNIKIVDFSMIALDGIYKSFQNKVWAEEEIKEKGIEFKTPWGKGLALETINDETVRIAQKQGYTVAVRKDPKKGFVRIKALPESKANLTPCYNIYKKMDPQATWFLHASRKMVLNGSVKNPDSKPSSLTLREIIDVLQK
ncbi:DHH family phosphoesterase [Candidatus Gottesmanbacteria bacterium]|nr:DHH family phosphoesterase [Candidatus Gottesmanbacteria bacterium]